MTVVVVDNELYGAVSAIAIKVSSDALLLDMCYSPPIGTIFAVHFVHVYVTNNGDTAHDKFSLRAEVVSVGVPTRDEKVELADRRVSMRVVDTLQTDLAFGSVQ